MNTAGEDPQPESRAPRHHASEPASDPGFRAVYQYLTYGLSLPERAVRATSAIVGGTLTESAALLVPQAFRSSRSYEIFVQQMLDFMVRDVAGVEHEPAAQPSREVESFTARKAVGGFIDMAGAATLHVSPLAVLAIVSDVAYGSQTYLKELATELKKAGVISEETTIDHAADLLEAVRHASNVAGGALQEPPLSVDGLRETIAQTQEALAGIEPATLVPQAEMQRIWDDMHELADREGVSMLEISSVMSLYAVSKVGQLQQGALSSVRITGNMFDRHILDHYRQALSKIHQEGLYATLALTSQPYIAAVWHNFSATRPTLTEDVVSGRALGRVWEGMRGWFRGNQAAGDQAAEPGE